MEKMANLYPMKRTALQTLYWMSAILLSGIILTSLGYSFPRAVVLSLVFIPCAMALDRFIPQTRGQEKGKRLRDCTFIVLGVLTGAILFLFFIHAMFSQIDEVIYYPGEAKIPAMLSNPAFIGLVLVSMAVGNHSLGAYLDKKDGPPSRRISFTSNYRKVTLESSEILFVESRDSEVWIYSATGETFRNKTPISQWESILGNGFLRTHRSYLVNISGITSVDAHSLKIGDNEIPISKKYAQQVAILLRELDILQTGSG